MSLHKTTFEYLMPTHEQQLRMEVMRANCKNFADAIDDNVPEGPDKVYILHKLREIAMWCNAAITRLPDGTPRT
jgi:hypothetical protein